MTFIIAMLPACTSLIYLHIAVKWKAIHRKKNINTAISLRIHMHIL